MSVRELDVAVLRDTVARLLVDANCSIPADVLDALRAAAAREDLGAEALYALDLDAFPAVVIIDGDGRNFHEEARARWRRG